MKQINTYKYGMKNIKNYINEKLHITSKQQYTYHPTTKDELQEIIIKRIKKEGPECDLNDIDVYEIKDMSHLFDGAEWEYGNTIFKDFNGDISLWNVSNVTNMNNMFWGCIKFNCNLSNWDVSNVEDMCCMFYWCEKFNCDLSKWDVSNVENMGNMFAFCKEFNCDISKWNVSNVKEMYGMFHECEKFNCDISKWNVSNVERMEGAFYKCPTKPKWYK